MSDMAVLRDRPAVTVGYGHWMNMFEISGAVDHPFSYRLVEIRNLPPGDEYDACLNQLVAQVARDVHAPVAVVGQGTSHRLAIPATAQVGLTEVQLTPHVAPLSLDDRVYTLLPEDQSDEARRIRTDFVAYALRTILRRDRRLWGRGRRWSSKRPLRTDRETTAVDVYPTFTWNVETAADGKLYLAVELSNRYIGRRWMSEYVHTGNAAEYRGRHCLYHYGHNWFEVEFWGLTRLSIAEQCFIPDGSSDSIDVLRYTREQCGPDASPWVHNLDPMSPAIVFRYPYKPKPHYGALALCKQIVSTQDAEAAGLHHRSIMNPCDRMARTQRVVERQFQGAQLEGRRIAIGDHPLSVERKTFAVPALRFGHGKVLAVGSASKVTVHGNRTTVPLHRLGRERLSMLLSGDAGPLDTTPFGPQYMLLPRSCPREVNEDFLQRVQDWMRRVSGNDTYTIRPAYYDDRNARNLYRQIQAVKECAQRAGISHGYALVLLPSHAHPRLHNQVKRTFWPGLQIQCATVAGLLNYYRRDRDSGEDRVLPERARQLDNYVRNCALAMMSVNRKWLWALEESLHYDVYIGVDVLNGMAGFTFVYNCAREMHFQNYPSKQAERLTATQMRDVLLTHLRDDLVRLNLHPRSIVIHRDGKVFPSELRGLQAAIDRLLDEGRLAQDTIVGVVDIRKDTASDLRLFEGNNWQDVGNPTIGSYYVLDDQRGIVCDTGQPFQFPGTADPVTAVIREGKLHIEFVLEDIFALSQLAFTAPDKCIRLPFTIKLADDLLRPIAAATDEHEARYDLDDLDTQDGRAYEDTRAGHHRAKRGGGQE